ncbi:uncharacterized protein ACMZJ9_022866 [Mantella aurantiaca]
MASADLRKKLECSICLKIYTDPVTLKCGHNFCRVCIGRVLDTQKESAQEYSCPECRGEFEERPELWRNITLRKIAESFRPVQPGQESGIFCTYCIHTPVPAVKSCLMCEASLCNNHLKVHSKSPEHILCDPTASLEDRKCSVHKKILEYYCTEDSVFICVSLRLDGEHRGHRAGGPNIGAVQKALGVSGVTDILLDVSTACNNLHISDDRKTVSSSYDEQNRPETPERFQSCPQVISCESFSSGRHYWEVDVGGSKDWTVGMCYPSIDRRGDQSQIGCNKKSWCLEWWGGNHYTVRHDEEETRLSDKVSSKRVGIYLDYEAGRISFYDLCDPIRHLHAFTTTFTEPLHAGIYQTVLLRVCPTWGLGGRRTAAIFQHLAPIKTPERDLRDSPIYLNQSPGRPELGLLTPETFNVIHPPEMSSTKSRKTPNTKAKLPRGKKNSLHSFFLPSLSTSTIQDLNGTESPPKEANPSPKETSDPDTRISFLEIPVDLTTQTPPSPHQDNMASSTSASSSVLQMPVEIIEILNRLPSKEDIHSLIKTVEDNHRKEMLALKQDVSKVGSRVQNLEESMTKLDATILQLTQSSTLQISYISQLQLQIDDQEDRERCNNLRLRGIPEATTNNDLEETVLAFFNRLLGPSSSSPIVLDRVHRALGPRLGDAFRPRDVICRLHYYKHKEEIVRRAWSQDELPALFAFLEIPPVDVPDWLQRVPETNRRPRMTSGPSQGGRTPSLNSRPITCSVSLFVLCSLRVRLWGAPCSPLFLRCDPGHPPLHLVPDLNPEIFEKWGYPTPEGGGTGPAAVSSPSESTLSNLDNFKEGTLILGGDFNFTLHPQMDNSKGHTSVPYSALKKIKKCLHNSQLVDIWRIIHPSDKDFTFYSNPHDTYSRIDMILLQHYDISKAVNSAFIRFTWAYRPARIASTVLHLSKQAGGIALPNIQTYYTSVHLARAMELCKNLSNKQWIQIEEAVLPLKLSAIPWLTRNVPSILKTHPTIGATWKICSRIFQTSTISPMPSPLTPILDHPEFPSGHSHTTFKELREKGRYQARHFMSRGRWLTLADMEQDSSLETMGFWPKFQLAHYLSSLPNPLAYMRPLTEFERLCSDSTPTRHSISIVHTIINAAPADFIPAYLSKWERDLGLQLTTPQREKILTLTHKLANSIRFQEANFKVISRWMASADLGKDLECSDFLNIYVDPEMLKCGHIFCIGRVLDTQEESGEYSCPECREEFGERPALHRNITLRNIAENFHPAQPDQERVIFCTYCIHTPVPAVKSCLLCEASLCDNHLKVHTKSPEHVLCDPTTSLEDRKCFIHKKILEYYCTEDSACICVSCRLDGEHRGHQVETLDEASDMRKKKLRNVLQRLMTKTKETERRVQSLQEHRRKVQGKAAEETQRVTALFRDLRRRLEDLEKRVLSEISGQAERISLSLSDIIQQLEIKKDELSRKMRHIEELCNMTDPLTVLQESHTGDLCDTEDGDDEDRERHDRLLHDGGDLDVAGISLSLHTGLSDIMSGVNVQECTGTHVYPHSTTEGKGHINAELFWPRPQPTPTIQRSHCQPILTIQRFQSHAVGSDIGAVQQTLGVSGVTDILMDESTAGNYLHISDDGKTASRERHQNRPETPERFQWYPQVLSHESFSSGRHYWEVDVGGSFCWIVGMCYPSIDRKRGLQSAIGYNQVSWCLERRGGNQYSAIHDRKKIPLPGFVSSNRVGIDLDYEAGRISFYKLCDPIRLLHTFTTTFTEPLHAGIYVEGGCITISGDRQIIVMNHPTHYLCPQYTSEYESQSQPRPVMASADLGKDLECSDFLNIYIDPEMLKCGHNFCIGRVLDTQEESGGYSCPECREEFQERPALHRNITLRNIAENFHPAQPDQESVIFCTYCIHTPVPAVKSCLLCEASLCDNHLKVHTKSPEHVLCDPTTSLEDRKCFIHKKILEYYCTEDSACICVSCRLDGEHRGHQVKTLDEASDMRKKKLRNVLQRLMTETEETERRVQSLQERRRKVQGKAAEETQRVTALFRDLRRRLEDLEKRVLSEISGQAERICLSLSDIIQQLEIKKDELSRKMRHIEELCNMTDPLTVLQESHTGGLCDTEDGDDEDRERHDRLLHDGGDLDVAGISLTLHTGLSDIMSGVNVQECTGTHVYPHSTTEGKGHINAELFWPRPQPTPTIQRSHCQPILTIQRFQSHAVGSDIGAVQQTLGVSGVTDILMDVSTAGNYLHISDDGKTASRERHQNRPETPERFQWYPQVLSQESFSSGRHYWEVDVGGSLCWIVGMCYPSIDRKRGLQSAIGYNQVSWCLERRGGNQYSAIHDRKKIPLPGFVSSNRVGIDLDYEAGRISFYELCDPIRLLHTFTTTFTEPLHAGIYVEGGCITISGGN